MTQIYYSVIENTPGCLPEGEGGVYTTWTDALMDADALGEDLQENGWACVHLQMQVGSWYVAQYLRIDMPHDLGRVVEINREMA